MNSLWTSTVRLPSYPTLEGECETDVLIIGGGLCGILCAHYLHEAGVDCTLIEAEHLCEGVSGHTTAKITSQHGLIYDSLLDRLGPEKARMYLTANEHALDAYRALAQTIPCDFEEQDAYVYARHDRNAIEDELTALEKLGFHAEFAADLPLPFSVAGAVKFPRQAQFHPLKLVAGLLGGLRIFENTRALSFDGSRIRTDRGTISANIIVVATHFPLFNKHGGYFLKLYQHRSYVIALENAPDLNGMYVDARDTGLSFRNAQNHLLLGGGGHRTGKHSNGWCDLKTFAKAHYPQATVRQQWATQDCMTLDRIPYIGQYAKSTPALYVATGFNKWGMTSSMVAADLLCSLIQDKHHDCEALFSPSRRMNRTALTLNAFESLLHMLTPTVPRCPHMGCALKWNRYEHTWDCPCHGSRFAENGTLLSGPANDNKE